MIQTNDPGAIFELLGSSNDNEPDVRAAARRAVCSSSSDAVEAADLLAMLGLMPSDDPDRTRG